MKNMKKEEYLQRPTKGVTHKDFDTEDVRVLKRLMATKKLTEMQRHALLRVMSMWYNLE